MASNTNAVNWWEQTPIRPTTATAPTAKVSGTTPMQNGSWANDPNLPEWMKKPAPGWLKTTGTAAGNINKLMYNLIPGLETATTGLSLGVPQSAAERAKNIALGTAGIAATVGGGRILGKVLPGFSSLPKVARYPSILGGYLGIDTLMNKFGATMPGAAATSPASQTAVDKTSMSNYKSYADYAAANPNAPAVKAVRTVNAGLQNIENVGRIGLSAEEKLSYEQALDSLRRSAGQSAASAALDEKQTRAQAAKGIQDIRQFTTGANMDVAGALADTGMGDVSAAGMGAERSLLARQATGTADINQNLADWLARQKLAASQRGSNVSAGVKNIREASAARVQANKDAAWQTILNGGQ